MSKTDNSVVGTPVPVDVQWRRRVLWRAGLHLAVTVLAVAVIATVVGAGAYFSYTGVVPVWLDSHGGRLAWMGFGALSWRVVFVELPQALDELTGALAEWWEARHLTEVARWVPFELPAGLDLPGAPETENGAPTQR